MKRLLALLMFIAITVMCVMYLASGMPKAATRVATAVSAPPERLEVTRAVMVRALQQKFEVTTFTMRLEKYVRGGVCEGNTFQRFAYTDCATMLVPAAVNAGFDWASFGVNNIDVTTSSIIVNLPAPRILNVVIDHAKIQVLGQEAGWISSPDKTLQTRLLAQADGAFRRDACTNGVLEGAGLSAEKYVGETVRTLLQAVGDTRTVRVFYPKPTC